MKRDRDCSLRCFAAFFVICVIIACPITAPVARAQSDGGFVTLKTFPAAVTAIGAFGGAMPVVVVATQNAGIYSMSGTSTIFKKLPALMDSMAVTSIVVLDPDRWLIGTDGDGLWLVKGAGTSLDKVTTLHCSRVSRVVQDSLDSNKLFLTSLCTGLNYSTDRGATWNSSYTGLTSLALTDIVRMDGDRIAVSSQDAGVYVSADNGASYAKTACPIKSVSSLAWSGSTRTLFAAGGSAVAMTTDAGAHWTSLPSPGTLASLVSLPSGAILAGIASRGALRWDVAAKAWHDVAQGAGVTSASAICSTGMTLLIGGSTGAFVRAILNVPVAAVSPSALDLGSVPVNQARSATFSITNLGTGVLDWRVESVPGYIQVTPQVGKGNAVVTVRVKGDGLSGGPHVTLLRVVTSGGNQILTLHSITIDAPPVRIKLTVGKAVGTVDGREVKLDAAPYIDRATSRTMVPMRFIGEAFGATVTWDAATRRVFVYTEGTTNHEPLLMVMTIGSKKATANGKAMTLETVPTIVAGRTFVPLRVISETLGADVSWNALTRAVSVSYIP